MIQGSEKNLVNAVRVNDMKHNRDLRRVGARTLSALTLVVLAAGPQTVAETTFDPRIAFSSSYTDNVRYVEGTEDSSDSSTSIRVTLPVERHMQHSSWLFRFDAGGSKWLYAGSGQPADPR
jgi:hypothetical protein